MLRLGAIALIVVVAIALFVAVAIAIALAAIIIALFDAHRHAPSEVAASLAARQWRC